ncbi:MAG: CPBP family intramembrane metalloprotease, partial [Oscillochloris sp.]|nr:CPBP family intramembrane metalloprotease [Oscillochloris sp.]
GAIVLVLLLGAGIAIGGEVGQFALASLNALPFAVLAVLAYLGGSHFNWAWLATGLWLALLVGVGLIGTLTLSLGSLMEISPGQVRPGNVSQDTGVWLRVGLLGLASLAAVLLSLLLLAPPVRRWLARFIPIDPDSFVHTVALVAVLSIGLICTIPLLVLGQPPLLTVLSQLGPDTAAAGRDSAGMLRDQLYGLVWTVPTALLAVGYGVRRNLAEALSRLGLVRPSWRQVLAGLGIALLLVAAAQLLGVGIDWLWHQLGWPLTDEAAFEQLLSFAINPLGAVVIGITAGLGEELAVRGALQPRLGILISNLFFMSLHALQYNWDGLLAVFLVGIVCGLVRARANTSTSAIVHGVYNFTLIMLSLLGGK